MGNTLVSPHFFPIEINHAVNSLKRHSLQSSNKSNVSHRIVIKTFPNSIYRKHHCIHMYKVHCTYHISTSAAAAAESPQSCPTLCDPRDGSPPGSPVPGILQARTLEWVAISFSNAWKWKAKVKSLSRAWLLATPWTAAYQAPPSMGFSRQEYWSGVPLPSPQKSLLYLILKASWNNLLR